MKLYYWVNWSKATTTTTTVITVTKEKQKPVDQGYITIAWWLGSYKGSETN